MAEPIRVLHVFGKLNMGGAETRVMDLYRHIDRSRVQFDFLVHHQITEEDRKVIRDDSSEELEKVRAEEDFDAEARSLGARIYVLPRFTGENLGEYKKACRRFFAAHHDWAVIEGHMTSMASVYLPIAKQTGTDTVREGRGTGSGTSVPAAGDAAENRQIPVTIAHARSAGVDAGIRGLATRLFRRSLSKKCDLMMSCSGPASISVFGEKAYQSGQILTVPNALDVDAFRFDPEARAAFRREFHIPEDAFVIGHVGRFDAVKNQKFLAEVGRELLRLHVEEGETSPAGPKRQNVIFLFLGRGKLQTEVQKAFDDEGLHSNAIFAGQLDREKTAEAYSAFDLFALPSLYEGLPGTVVEAQAAGLPCLIADTITKEVALTDLVQRLPLDQPGVWSRAAAAVMGQAKRRGAGSIADAASDSGEAGYLREVDRTRVSCSRKARQKLDAAGYNVKTEAIRLQKLYERLAETGKADVETARKILCPEETA